MIKKSCLIAVAFVMLGIFLMGGPAWATLDMAKLYKSTFATDEKPKCTTCHVEKIPKKDDGKHELNDYGKKLKAEKPGDSDMPTEETLKKVGKNENAEF